MATSRNDHFNDITMSGNLSVSATSKVEGNLIPDTDDLRTLGDATHRWKALHVSDLLNAETFTLTNQASAPATPAAGTVVLYSKTSDQRVYYKEDDGTEVGPLVPGVSWVNVKSYGAKGDGRQVFDAVLTQSSTTVTSATAAFTQADVGKLIWGIPPGTGLSRLPLSTIVTVNSATSIITSQAATNNSSSVNLRWGTDDSAAMTSAKDATIATGFRNVGLGTMYMPEGFYICNKQTAVACVDFFTGGPYDGMALKGDGPKSTQIWPTPAIVLSAVLRGNCWDFEGTTYAVDGIGCDGGNFTYTGADRYGVAYSTNVPADAGVTAPYRVGNTLVTGWKTSSTACGVRVAAASLLMFNSRVTNSSCGINVSGSDFTFLDSASANNSEYNLQFTNVAGYKTTHGGSIINSFSDECDILTGCVKFQAAKDIRVVNSVLYGSTGGVAAQVDGTSEVSFTDSRVGPFDVNNNETALEIIAGGIVKATGTTFEGTGTGFGLNNAGTFIDGGGNTVVGGTTGAGMFAGQTSITGTAQVTANIVLTSGWDTSTKSAISGDSRAQQFTITGAGTPGASPVITITHPTPFWRVPICTMTQVGGTFGVLTNPVPSAASVTSVAFTFTGTPVAAQTYVLQVRCD